jgi:hypothetical protein
MIPPRMANIVNPQNAINAFGLIDLEISIHLLLHTLVSPFSMLALLILLFASLTLALFLPTIAEPAADSKPLYLSCQATP